MIPFIERLREKPIEHKRRVAFLTTTVITGAIFVAWLTTQSFSIGSTNQVAGTAAAPLKVAGENINAAYDTMKDQFNTMKDQYNQETAGANTSDSTATQDNSSVTSDPTASTNTNYQDNMSIDIPQESTNN